MTFYMKKSSQYNRERNKVLWLRDRNNVVPLVVGLPDTPFLYCSVVLVLTPWKKRPFSYFYPHSFFPFHVSLQFIREAKCVPRNSRRLEGGFFSFLLHVVFLTNNYNPPPWLGPLRFFFVFAALYFRAPALARTKLRE